MATDLQNLVNFDYTQTLPVADINSKNYEEGMSLYLETLGLASIDAEYNKRVKEYEAYLQELEFGSKLTASLMSDMQANQAVEAQPGLGTGAFAIASEGRQKALGAVNQEIESGVANAYQEGMSSIAEEYQAVLESKLGKYDPVTGTFENLADYEVMANAATQAMAKLMASTIDTSGNGDWEDILKSAGYTEGRDEFGNVVFTEKGQQYLESLVNNINVNESAKVFGNKTFTYALAEQMAKDAYTTGYTTEDGLNGWEVLSSTKKNEIINEYHSWLTNNQDALRLTEWELYDKTDDGYIIDRTYETPKLDDSIYHEGVHSDSGKSLAYLSVDDVSDCSQEEFDKIKLDLISGKISDGTYFTFQSGKAYKGDKFYYISNGAVFKTDYTVDNPPPVIRADQANVYSFGRYYDTGTGKGKQDSYIQTLIDSAIAGRLPNGTEINVNYGQGNSYYYRYVDGMFIHITNDEAGKTTLVYNADGSVGIKSRYVSPQDAYTW